MEPRKRERGAKLREIQARITPELRARTFKQMSLAVRIADAMEDKGWSKSEFAARMNQLPSVITRWLSGTQNFTIDTLSDIEEVLGVQLLVTDIRPAADAPKTQAPIVQERIVEHHYIVYRDADTVLDSCPWSGTQPTAQFSLIVNPSPSLN